LPRRNNLAIDRSGAVFTEHNFSKLTHKMDLFVDFYQCLHDIPVGVVETLFFRLFRGEIGHGMTLFHFATELPLTS
jgi:hypothetical protein